MVAILWILLLCAVGLEAREIRDIGEDADKYLLPWNIRPEHYDLTLYTHIEQFQPNVEESFVFMGIVEISFLVLYGDVSEVVLHTFNEITIVSAQITELDGATPQTFNVTIGDYDDETNKQTFFASPALTNNNRYRITVYYIGRNHAELRGFYRSSYQDSNNQTKWLLTTHFESFGARQAFPCFDEPEYKATFKLTVHYNQTLADQGYSAFFNTEIESEEIRNGEHVTTFKTTPRPLSTYLVAFIVAPFSKSPEPSYFNSSFNGENPLKPLRTIGQPKYFSPRQDLLSQVVGPAALNTMTKLTGVGFGFDKVEQAGIPDFGPGAMENWGLVTYRESAVFFNNQTGTTAQRQSIVSTNTHELAHQWFGDLVTLHWWTDVWLNEGYATFFATHAANEFREPELNTSDWNLIGQFVTGTLQRSALQADSKPTSRPLTAEAYLPDTIDSYFDSISYDKGGSVIRMWLHILGPEVFYAGLNRYLRLQQESVGTPEILLASWDGALDGLPPAQRPNLPASVAELLQGWHLQAGYPVVSVSRQGANLTISQERFLSSPGNDSSRWNVPLSYSTNLEVNFNDTSPVGFLLTSAESTSLQLRNASASWVVVNNQETGYYRVNYDSDNWAKLIDIVNNSETAGQIHEFNRAQIIDDAANLAASTHKEYLTYDVFLNLLQSLTHERSLIVWNSALNAMERLLHLLASDYQTYDLLKDYFLRLVEPTFAELGLQVLPSDSHTTKLLRTKVAKLACFLDLPLCQQQAKSLFSKGFVHPDIRQVVMCEAVKNGDINHWEDILGQVFEAEQPIRSDLLTALTCTRDSSLIQRLLKLLQSNIFQDIEVFDIISALTENHPDKSWIQEVMVLKNARRWSISSKNMLKLITIASRSLLSVDGIKMEKNMATETYETVLNNRHWFSSKQPSILDWLKSDSY